MDYDGDEDVALEDVLNALLIRLLDPLLHNLNPVANSSCKEQHIANQMEALAWLYNHYLRKSFPHHPFLDSPHLCRKAVIQRANLASYLSFENGEKTLAELSVAKACDAAGSQESAKTKDEGCRVSRVAALVLSPCRKQCVLVQSLVTKSVWSFVEADVGHGRKVIHKGDIRSNSFPNKKSKLANPKNLISAEDESQDAILMQSILSAVENQTGIEPAVLNMEEEYLEAQCMSQETASTRLYILVCSNLCDIKAASHIEKAAWVALDEVLSRAAGPLVEASGWGVYPASAIDYFHIRPFCDLLQKNLSQKLIGRSCLGMPSFENGSCTEPQKALENGLESSILVQPNKKGVLAGSIPQDDPNSKVIIVEDQEDDPPRRCRGSSGERNDSNFIYSGSSTKASRSDICGEPKVKLLQNYGSKGRKLSQKDGEIQIDAKECLQNTVLALGSRSLGMQDGCKGSQLIDTLQEQTPIHVTNCCKGKKAQMVITTKVEVTTASPSSKVDMDGKMMARVEENIKDDSKASQGSKPSDGSSQEISYIRPKVQGRSLKGSTSIIKEIKMKGQECETKSHQNGQFISTGLQCQSLSEYFLLPKTVENLVQEPNGELSKQLITVNELEVSSKSDIAATTVDKKDTTSPYEEAITTEHMKDVQALKEKRRQSFKGLLELTDKYQSQSEALLKDISEYDKAIQMILHEA